MMSKSPPKDGRNNGDVDESASARGLFSNAKNLFKNKFSLKLGAKEKSPEPGPQEEETKSNKFKSKIPGKTIGSGLGYYPTVTGPTSTSPSTQKANASLT
jgi:hypothetical protein